MENPEVTSVDISAISSDNSFLDLLYPGSQNALGLQLEILPPDDPKIKTYIKKERDRQIMLTRKGRPPLSDQEEKVAKELCNLAVINWRWTSKTANWNGEQPAFDRMILADMVEKDWLRNQIDDHLGDIKNFFRK